MLASQGLKFFVFFFRVYCVVFVTYNIYVVIMLCYWDLEERGPSEKVTHSKISRSHPYKQCACLLVFVLAIMASGFKFCLFFSKSDVHTC